jgi:hypothetical protein
MFVIQGTRVGLSVGSTFAGESVRRLTSAATAIDRHAVAVGLFLEQGQIGRAVIVHKENILAVVAALGHIM